MASVNTQSRSKFWKTDTVTFSKLASVPGIIALSILASITMHWLPNLGTPLHSDTAFIFLLQAASQNDQVLASSIPEGLRSISAFPQNPIAGAIDLAQRVDRYNIVNFVQFWLTARVGGENADVWRIVPIVFNGAAVGIFVGVARRIRISTPITLVLAGWLLLYPLETWVDYNKSESLGVFFMMAALGASLQSGTRKWAIVSAASMVAAGLTKEPFLAAWPLVGGAVAYRILVIERSGIERRHLVELIPHAAGAVFVVAIFGALSISGSSDVGYATSNSIGGSLPLFKFFTTYARNIFLIPASDLAGPLIFGLFVVSLLVIASRKLQRGLLLGKADLILIAALLAGLALHGVIHFATDREIAGRYVIPANFEIALLGGLVVSRAMRSTYLRNWRTGASLVGLVLIGVVATSGDRYVLSAAAGLFVASAVYLRFKFRQRQAMHAVILGGIGIMIMLPLGDAALADAGKSRADWELWQDLIATVARDSPEHARVKLNVDDPNMLEMAQSLEAHTLLRGRSDLEYSFQVLDTARLESASPYLLRLIDEFNAGRSVLPRNSVNVFMDRNGQRDFIREDSQASGFEKIWNKVSNRYGSDRPSFLHFEIVAEHD